MAAGEAGGRSCEIPSGDQGKICLFEGDRTSMQVTSFFAGGGRRISRKISRYSVSIMAGIEIGPGLASAFTAGGVAGTAGLAIVVATVPRPVAATLTSDQKRYSLVCPSAGVMTGYVLSLPRTT